MAGASILPTPVDTTIIEKPALQLECVSVTSSGVGGKGGLGGSGSPGGQGGGGAGGPSYGILIGGTGKAEVSESTRITEGQPAAAAGTGAAGEASKIKRL